MIFLAKKTKILHTAKISFHFSDALIILSRELSIIMRSFFSDVKFRWSRIGIMNNVDEAWRLFIWKWVSHYFSTMRHLLLEGINVYCSRYNRNNKKKENWRDDQWKFCEKLSLWMGASRGFWLGREIAVCAHLLTQNHLGKKNSGLTTARAYRALGKPSEENRWRSSEKVGSMMTRMIRPVINEPLPAFRFHFHSSLLLADRIPWSTREKNPFESFPCLWRRRRIIYNNSSFSNISIVSFFLWRSTRNTHKTHHTIQTRQKKKTFSHSFTLNNRQEE